MANDSTVKAGSWGARTVEKIIRIIERAYADRRADGLPGRLGRRPDHRPGRPVPRPARRREDLLEPGARVRLDPAGVRAVRPVARPAAPTSRRSATSSRWSTATPRCTSAPTAWSRWSPARRPRSRRWAAPGSTVPSPASATSCARPRTRRSTSVRRYLSYLPSNWQGSRRPPTPPSRRPTSTSPRWCRPASGRPSTCAGSSRGCSTTGSFFEIQALWAREVTRRLRPARRRGRRRRRATTRCSRAACSSSTRPTRRPASCSSATRSTCRCCSSPTCPASWSAPRWRSRASSGTAPR